MNLVKRFSVGSRTKGRIRAFRKIKTLVEVLLLLILDSFIGLWLANSSYSSVKLARELT